MDYTVYLQDAPSDITEQAKSKAERQFQRVLEHSLGSDESY